MKRWASIVGVCVLAVIAGLFASAPAFWFRYADAQLHLGLADEIVARPRAALIGVEQASPSAPITATDAARLQALARPQDVKALVILQNGAVVFEAYGDGKSPSETFDGEALTRILPIFLAGALLADGTLPGYDAAIGEWLEDFAKAPRASITLAHLLTMSSGLETPRLKLAPFSSGTQFLLGTDIGAALAVLPLRGTPGAMRRDNPADSQALVQLIERARGEDFATLFARRLWSPIGGGDATFALDRRGGMALGHCCFRARAIDWVRLADLFVTRGRVGALMILPAQFLEDMAKPSADAHFGMGVRRLSEGNPSLPADTIAVEGGGGQWLIAIPSRRLAVARFGEALSETALVEFLQTVLALVPATPR